MREKRSHLCGLITVNDVLEHLLQSGTAAA